jgi:hypothetical protein
MVHEKEVVDLTTGELEKLNSNFVQLYIDKLDLIVQMTNENPNALKVFIWIIKHMDRRNALVVSQTALAEAFGVSDRWIRYSIAYLKEKKALSVLKSGSTNIYAVNAQIAWKATANGKKHALFDAAVYISSAEQENNIFFDTNLVCHAVKRTKGKGKRGNN